VSGTVSVHIQAGKKLEHAGIKVELIGQIGKVGGVVRVTLMPGTAELFYDRSNPYEFTSMVIDLESPGEMVSSKSYPFAFKNSDKQFESYTGINVKLRCVLLRVS